MYICYSLGLSRANRSRNRLRLCRLNRRSPKSSSYMNTLRGHSYRSPADTGDAPVQSTRKRSIPDCNGDSSKYIGLSQHV